MSKIEDDISLAMVLLSDFATAFKRDVPHGMRQFLVFQQEDFDEHYKYLDRALENRNLRRLMESLLSTLFHAA